MGRLPLNAGTGVTCSVCIANYNGIGVLEECIASVRSQVFDGTLEIIVHDDASTDASRAYLRGHDDIHSILSDENVGFCVANNRMAAVARGEYILLLNNDAVLFPDSLATLLMEATGNPTPRILTLPQYDYVSGDLVDRACLLDPFYNPVPLHTERQSAAMVIGACLWIPTSAWRQLGGLPEWMGSIAEDLYLCCAARQRGMLIACCPRSGYRHRQGHSFGGNRVVASRLSSTYRRRALSERNKAYAMVIFTPGLIVWPLLLAHVVLLVGEGLALALVQRERRVLSEIYLGAITSLWRRRQMLRKERSLVSTARTISALAYLSGFTLVPRKLVMLIRHGIPTLK